MGHAELMLNMRDADGSYDLKRDLDLLLACMTRIVCGMNVFLAIARKQHRIAVEQDTLNEVNVKIRIGIDPALLPRQRLQSLKEKFSINRFHR